MQDLQMINVLAFVNIPVIGGVGGGGGVQLAALYLLYIYTFASSFTCICVWVIQEFHSPPLAQRETPKSALSQF